MAPLLDGRAGPVPDAPHSGDDGRVIGILLDLRAQALHMDVHQTGVGLVLVAPHLLEEHLASEHLLRLARQDPERGYSDCGVPSSTGTRKLPSMISFVRSATMVLTSSGSFFSGSGRPLTTFICGSVYCSPMLSAAG